MDKTKGGWNQGSEVEMPGVVGEVVGKGRQLYLSNNKKIKSLKIKIGQALNRLFPRRHTKGQQIYEQMVHLTSYNKNANENHIEIPPRPYQNYQQEITSIVEDLEKKEPSFTVVGNVDHYRYYGKQYGFSSEN